MKKDKWHTLESYTEEEHKRYYGYNRHKSNFRLSILCNWCFQKKSAIFEACTINFFSMFEVYLTEKYSWIIQHYELNMMIILLLTLSYNDALHHFLFWFDWILFNGFNPSFQTWTHDYVDAKYLGIFFTLDNVHYQLCYKSSKFWSNFGCEISIFSIQIPYLKVHTQPIRKVRE